MEYYQFGKEKHYLGPVVNKGKRFITSQRCPSLKTVVKKKLSVENPNRWYCFLQNTSTVGDPVSDFLGSGPIGEFFIIRKLLVSYLELDPQHKPLTFIRSGVIFNKEADAVFFKSILNTIDLGSNTVDYGEAYYYFIKELSSYNESSIVIDYRMKELDYDRSCKRPRCHFIS